MKPRSTVNFTKIANAMGAEAVTANKVFKSDGLGSGDMTKNTQVIPRRITVGKGGDVDYTSLASAVTYAIGQGVSVSNPFEILMRPGTYTEPPMTVVPGLTISTDLPTRIDTVFIVAQNPNEDLFTCFGGYFAGISVSGVTDPLNALFYCSTPMSLTVFHGVSIKNCSNGIIVANGASAICMMLSININGINQRVATGVTVTGTNSYVGFSNMFVSVPSVLLPFYGALNPVETCVRVSDNAIVELSGSVFRMSHQVATPTNKVIFSDGGSRSYFFSGSIFGSAIGCYIGPVGNNTRINILGIAFRDCINNLHIDSATGSINTIQSVNNINGVLVPGAKRTGIIQDRNDNTIKILGEFKYQFETGRETDIADFFEDAMSTGVCDGGALTKAGGLDAYVSEGDAWIVRGDPYDDAQWVEWPQQTITLTPSMKNYIVYDATLTSIIIQAGPASTDQALLGIGFTNATEITFLHNTKVLTDWIPARLQEYLETTRKLALISGLATQQGTTNLNIEVASGSYYTGLNPHTCLFNSGDAYFSYFYDDGYQEIPNVFELDDGYYDNGGVLTELTDGYFKCDTVYVTSDCRITVIYGKEEFETQAEAELASYSIQFAEIEPTGFPTSKIIIEKNNGAVEFMDIRSQPAYPGGGGGGAGDHSLLSNLDKDTHLQYLPLTGVRNMTGPLNMGTKDITNVGTVDGVDVSAHAIRHDPGGIDALTIDVPVTVIPGAPIGIGAAPSYALSDHQHGIEVDTPETVGTANNAGVKSKVSRADHIHSHGNQLGGSLHATAVAGVSDGFISAANQTKLDGVEAGATNTPYSAALPLNVTKAAASAGVINGVSRVDHKHDISTAAPGTTTFNAVADEGVATSLARSDHAHALTLPAAPEDVTKAAASAGVSANVARQDHKHDISTAAPGTTTFNAVADEGVATSLARSDHAHVLTLPAAPANVTKAAASAGASANVARQDHKHDIDTAAPNTITFAAASAEGSATSLARSDHTHALTLPAAPANVTKAAASAGASANVARQDHKHDISTAAPVSIGSSNLEGSATTLARSDHVHDGSSYMPVITDSNDTIPFPISGSRAATNRALANTYVGAKFNVYTRSTFVNAYCRLNAATAGAIVRLTIYQTTTGISGTANLIATGSVTLVGGGAQNIVIPITGTLVPGVCHLLIGIDGASGATMRVYTNAAADTLNQNVPVGKAPTTYTTAIVVNGTPPATFNAAASGTATTVDTAIMVRLGA